MEDVFYVPSKKAKELLHVCLKTLQRWDKEGKIRVIRDSSGRRRYHIKDIQNINGDTSSIQIKEKICYCRVSSAKQKDDLIRQKDLLTSKFPNHTMVTDVGSGINWKRKGLKTVLDKAMRGHISEIVVAHRDRLCRFAFELLEWIFERCGVKLVVLDEEKNKSCDKELTDDILSIIHVYSCRNMGRRRYKNKENKDVSNSVSKTNNKTVDGDEEICVQ